ncbi:hypothetical protein V8E53_012271 [Lactarius tabidus]
MSKSDKWLANHYIELQVTKVTTPWQATSVVIKAFWGIGPDSKSATTSVMLEWIGCTLAEASTTCGGEGTWKSKNTVVYLFKAVTTCSGGTGTRHDSHKPKHEYCAAWFGNIIFSHLQAAGVAVFTQCCRCICFFNLTKEQLVLVLPLLNHLKLQKVIMCAYTVVALSCILSMCAGGSTILMFSFVGLQPFAPQLPNVLLVKIGVHQSLGHMVECNFLMHCVVRAIIMAKKALAGECIAIL